MPIILPLRAEIRSVSYKRTTTFSAVRGGRYNGKKTFHLKKGADMMREGT